MQVLEKLLLPKVGIYAENDALVFCNVSNPSSEPIDIASIMGKPVKKTYGQRHNFVSWNRNYFTTDGFKCILQILAVTGPCVVFCGYTLSEDGTTKSSGFYHALCAGTSYDHDTEVKVHQMIDTVRPNKDERIIVKIAGNNGPEKYENIEWEKQLIIRSLASKGVEVNPKKILLGGRDGRITKFYPLTGQLVTSLAKYVDTGRHDLYVPIRGTRTIL